MVVDANTGTKFVLKESSLNGVCSRDFSEMMSYLKRVIGIKHDNLVTNSCALITPNDFTMLQCYVGDKYKTLYDFLEDRKDNN
jgi:hypothetical protein